MATKEKHEPDIKPAMPQTGCVVCGQYTGALTETAGNARWHESCGQRRPDVIRKVKARA